MRKQVIAIASIASILSGIGVMGLVISIQHDPLAWTQASRRNAEKPKPSAISPEPGAAVSAGTASAELPSDIVHLPEVRITASRQSQAAARQGEPIAPEQLEPPLEPCSEWREIGPLYVEQGIASGSQRVRQLC